MTKPRFQSPTDADLAHRYLHHPPKGDQAERYELIRAKILEAAKCIRDLTPCSPEQSLMFNALDQAMFLANASIARHEGLPPIPLVPNVNMQLLEHCGEPINLFVAIDEFGNYGIGDTEENAEDDYITCFGNGKSLYVIHSALNPRVPSVQLVDTRLRKLE